MGLLSKFKKVLVVEDDPALRKALVTKLSNEGYTVIDTDKGNEVVGLIQIEKPNLLVLDLMLPGRDGMSILELMRGEDWKNKTPVIILTNLSGNSGLKKQASDLDATYFDKASTDISTIVEEVKRRL